jgi:hypothetical protein
MPGFNQQGPVGTGSMTGKGRGMCRRTEDLDVPTGRGGGRGLGNRCRVVEPPPAGRAQGARKFAQGEEMVPDKDNEKQGLAELREEFRKASADLQKLSAKIEAMERSGPGSEQSGRQ